MTTTLRPLGNTVLFRFLDETSGTRGEFSERTRSGLYIPKLQTTQRGERWGQVRAGGPDAATDVAVGEYVLIEPLMWTMSGEVDGEKLWKTTTDKIMAVTTDLSLTVQY